MLTIQQLESTTPNHRHRPGTIKLLAPVTVDISVSMGYSELKMKPSTVNVNNPAGVVDSSCWIVNIYCRWFKFSSEEPVLTEISTVTGANNLIVLRLRRWFGVVDLSCWISSSLNPQHQTIVTDQAQLNCWHQ
jgi:hypothetical protein